MNQQTPFEIYVHVPFCLKRCGYCDFNTYTATNLGGGVSRSSYADMVIDELSLVKIWQEEHGIIEPPAHTIFFGGGTPTILAPEDLVKIVLHIRNTWGIEENAEITTEANPDTVDYDYLSTLRDGGFNRISFGMQSAVPHVLRTLDRTHDQKNVMLNVKNAQKLNLRSSVDLIYGTPGESLDDWRQSVQAALDLDVKHISAYALSLEPTTKMGRMIAAGKLAQTDDDDEAAKYEIADEMFENAGLRWYEVSNWSRPGYESEHNLGYWRNVDWAGVGPGAHSHYNRPRIRSWDMHHPKIWGQSVQKKTIPWSGSEQLDDTMNLEELAILGLRMREGLNISSFERTAGQTIPEVTLAEFVREGLATIENGNIVATRRGRLLNDSMIAQVLAAVGK
ncbi:radical SAM family heme chaperone HemW [Alloscardovia criceti]|uniref:radical SAM family heme chaperone HemW n=1 Tax=Alloscardovia criceti TaxID=356828 RepID=UPI000525A934|nr:radical SAM family heme chaperone HemW [Alloscardovia criceti]